MNRTCEYWVQSECCTFATPVLVDEDNFSTFTNVVLGFPSAAMPPPNVIKFDHAPVPGYWFVVFCIVYGKPVITSEPEPDGEFASAPRYHTVTMLPILVYHAALSVCVFTVPLACAAEFPNRCPSTLFVVVQGVRRRSIAVECEATTRQNPHTLCG
jgi:hypothetical protein